MANVREMPATVTQLGCKELSSRVIGAAIQVHRSLGPGFLESIYEVALAIELDAQSIKYERQKPVLVTYRNLPVGEHGLDMLIEGVMVVELKAVTALDDIFF